MPAPEIVTADQLRQLAGDLDSFAELLEEYQTSIGNEINSTRLVVSQVFRY